MTLLRRRDLPEVLPTIVARRNPMMQFHSRFNVQKICLVLLAFFSVSLIMWNPGSLQAEDPDTLARQADTLLRDAERKMFSGKNEEAMNVVEEAGKTIEQLKAADPSHKKIKILENKWTRTSKAIERTLGKSSGSSASPKQTAPKAAPAGASDKLPGGVSKRLKDISRELDTAEKMAARNRIDNARLKLEGASDLFGEIDKMYGGKFSTGHPDYVAAQKRYAAVEQSIGGAEQQKAASQAQAAQAQQAMQEQSDKWVRIFIPYVANQAAAGHNPDKYLVYPGTTQPAEMKKMQQVYEELQGLFAEYQKEIFPNGKTWQLEQAERDVQFALENFSESYAGGMKSVEENVNRNLDQALGQLERDSGWKSDAKALPPIVDSKRKESIGSLVAQVEKTLPANDPALKEINEKYERMLKTDQEHRKIRAERTFVRPEVYKGKDLKDLRKKAEAIVKKERPGAKILRVSVYKDNWKEERVLESTDSTNTAIRYRITRMINAQVATKSKGDVSLNTLHIAKDKQGSGWGQLYGHIMYSDPMVEKNVNK